MTYTAETAIAQLDSLDQTIAFVASIFQPILDANNGVCPTHLADDTYLDTLEQLRNTACQAKHTLNEQLDFATRMQVSRIRAARQGRE